MTVKGIIARHVEHPLQRRRLRGEAGGMLRRPRHLRLGMQAVETVLKVATQQRSLESMYQATKSGVPPYEQGTLRELCSGTLRHWHYCDAVIDAVAPLDVRADPTARLVLSTTLYEAMHMRRTRRATKSKLVAQAAACAQALDCSAGEAAVQDACQRILSLGQDDLDALQTAASALSLPGWLHDRLAAETPLASYGALLLRRPDFLSLNVHPAEWTAAEYAARLRADGHADAAPHGPWVPHAVLLRSRPRDVAALPGISAQRVHVQDAVQQYGVSLLRPLPEGDRVLDACAAPGGKTRALLNSQPHVRVLALDVSRQRARAMEASLAGGGSGVLATQVRVHCADAAKPHTWWDGEPFGAVILDVPCSGSGIVRTHPEVKLRHTAASVAALRQVQLQLLRGIWPLLRDGGELLYSTCSVLAEENASVVQAFAAEAAEAAAGVSLAALAPPQGEGVSCAASAEGITFFPSAIHQGGFVALLRKESGAKAPTARQRTLPNRGERAARKLDGQPARARVRVRRRKRAART
jgi:16S rRNA (cytosine967-C5)-methyltransferase